MVDCSSGFVFFLWCDDADFFLTLSGTGADVSGSLYGHEYVDLMLPSGSKWATCNIGASGQEEEGQYFAWGEHSGYYPAQEHYFWWTNYRFTEYIEESRSFTKYCTQKSNGNVDDKVVLDISDDVARAKWGGTWRMPTSLAIYTRVWRC